MKFLMKGHTELYFINTGAKEIFGLNYNIPHKNVRTFSLVNRFTLDDRTFTQRAKKFKIKIFYDIILDTVETR